MVLKRPGKPAGIARIVLGMTLAGTCGFASLDVLQSTPSVSAESWDSSSVRGDVGVLTQSTDPQGIQQVGENDNGDVEMQDEGAPAVGAVSESTTTSAVEDIELLDQGATPSQAAPPAAVPMPAAPPAASGEAPASTGYVAAPGTAPEASGRMLPPGFDSGSVHVSAGRGGFPTGLEACHVGVVTGRAYVGILCGDGNNGDVVGFAPSFLDFPFVPDATFPFDPDSRLVTEENFPFDENSGFFAANDTTGNEDGDVTVISAGTHSTRSGAESLGSKETTNGVVEVAQRTRERKPHVRVSGGAGKQSASENQSKKKTKSNSNAESSNSTQTSANTKTKQKAHEANTSRDKVKADRKGQKAKDSRKSKKSHKRNKRRSQHKH